MNETIDREKKIAEIRETVTCFMGAGNDTEYDRALNTLKENAGERIPFLLSELDRIQQEYAEERAAHNAHVTELCELEKENRKLREELEKDLWNYAKELELSEAKNDLQKYFENWHRALNDKQALQQQLQSAQQEIERLGNLARQERELADHWMRKHHDDVVKLREEREKMIEGLRWYAEEQNYDGSEFRLSETEKDKGQRARDILKSIGIDV